MFGKIVQKWSMLKSEWSEYKKLRQECARNWRVAESARAKLTRLYDSDNVYCQEHQDSKSCIEIIFSSSKLMRVDEPVSLPQKIVETYCPSFDAGVNGVRPCANVYCPMHKANQEYVRAMADYTAAVQRRRAFWKQNGDKTK